VLVEWKRGDGFKLSLELPEGMTARVELPAVEGAKQVLVNGQPVVAQVEKDRWVLADALSGKTTVEVK
jgi:alpha-L-rhamnosidase